MSDAVPPTTSVPRLDFKDSSSVNFEDCTVENVIASIAPAATGQLVLNSMATDRFNTTCTVTLNSEVNVNLITTSPECKGNKCLELFGCFCCQADKNAI